jgi:hypothetical protein
MKRELSATRYTTSRLRMSCSTMMYKAS